MNKIKNIIRKLLSKKVDTCTEYGVVKVSRLKPSKEVAIH